MTTWRNHKCIVGYCERWASLDIRTLPLCYDHGLEVARNYELRITADKNRREREARTRRIEVRQERIGNREGEVVYYVQIGNYIKIGYTSRLRNRFTTLRADALLAIEPGDEDLEKQRHTEFTAERIDRRRENFRPSERLMQHIAKLHDEHGIPTWANRPRTSVVTVRQQEPK